MASTLDVSRALKNPGQVFPFQADIALPEMEFFSDVVRFERVVAEGEFLSTDDGRISVRAQAEAQVVAHCSRCLDEVRETVHADIDALYAQVPDPEDPDQYGYAASVVELTDAVRDAIVLEVPMRFLCKPDCKGLCPTCGANLNRSTCTCLEEGEVLNPFSALKSIMLNNEEV